MESALKIAGTENMNLNYDVEDLLDTASGAVSGAPGGVQVENRNFGKVENPKVSVGEGVAAAKKSPAVPRLDSASPLSADGGNVSVGDFEGSDKNVASPLEGSGRNAASPLGKITLKNPTHLSRFSLDWERAAAAVDYAVTSGRSYEDIEREFGSAATMNPLALKHLARARREGTGESSVPILTNTLAFSAAANSVWSKCGGDASRLEDDDKRLIVASFLRSKGFEMQDFAEADGALKPLFGGKSLDAVTEWVFNSYLAEREKYDLMAEYSRVVPSRREDWLQANGYADATKFMVANAPKGMAQNFVALTKASPRERELAINLAATLRECASTGEWFKTHTVMRVGEKLAGLNPSAQMRVLALMDSMNPDLQKNFFVELGGRIQESFENTWNGAMTLVEQATISAALPENLRDKESTRRAIEADLRARSLAMGAVKRNYAKRGMIGELLMDTGVMFADTALIMGAAAATGGVGAAVATAGWFGVGSAGNAYQDMVAKGVSPDDALIPALTIGVAEAGSEYLTAMIPLGRGVKNLIVGKGAKSAALDLLSRDFFYKVASGETQATVKGALGRFMGRGALGMAEETGTELVSSAWSAGVYKHLGIYEDGEFLDEAAQIIKTMPGVFLLGALTGTGAGKLKQRWKGGAGPITQLGMELDLAKMESDKQTAEAMRMAGSLLGMKFNAATGDVLVGRNDALGFDLIDLAEWGEMSGNEKTQELEAKFFRGEKHGDADVAKARELFDFMSKLSEAQAEGATRTATENAAAETAEAEREAEAARTADNGRRTTEKGQGTNETEGGNARQENAGEKKGVSAALREFVENMAIWKRLEQEAQDYDIAEDVAAALGYDVEAKRPEVVEALKKIFERGDSDAHVAAILSAYAKRAIALEKMSGGKAAEGATKPSALALLVEAANSYGDFGNATGERIVEPEQTADGAESAIPKEAFAGIPEAWRKTLAAAFLVIDRHAAALKGTTHDVASAKREIAAALKGKKGFHELSDTARAMLSALERYDGDLDGVRRWLSAYASGARRSKGARTAKELSADADEFATGSREIGDNYASRRVYVGEGELTEAERNLVRAVSRINAATGGKLQIRFFDGVHADAYGFIEGDVIHVNRQGAQALLTTFGHEFTHWLEGNANYAAMRDFVLKPGGACELIFAEMFGRSFAEHKARIKASYKARGHELSDEQADAELLADACGATLFTRNFEALTEIRRANKGFFGKLLDFLKRLVNAVRGTKFEREVSEAVELYRKAAFEARRAEGTETKTETETAGTETAGTREEGTQETERTEGTEGGTEEAKPANETFRKIVEGEWEIPQAVTDAVPELKGKIVCDDEAYAHIWARHKKELQGLGYESAKAFVDETLANADAVYAAKNSGYDLVARMRGKESSANRVFVYLKKTKDGGFYDVGTAHITKSKKYENTNPLWERTPNVSAVANLNSEKQNPSPKADAENGARDGSEVKPIFDEKGKVSFGGSAAVSVTEDKWGIYRAYADEAGEKHKFPSQYPSFRELLARVALKRGVPKDEVFREASERLTRAMQEADNGKRATDSGNTSGGFSGENGRGSEYSSGNPAGTRNAWSARTPSAEKSVVVSGEYRVVDADELTFVDVSDKTQQNEQERNRQGRRTQQQTRGMLYDFVAERLLEDAHTDRGAPIYRELEDGKLRSVSGEGRSRLLKDVYDSGGEPEAQYRAALEKFARERGIEIPAGIKKPVLVRVAKDTGGMSWETLAKASNMDMKSAYSTSERAHADARELGKCLPLLNARSEDDLLGEKNHAFVVAFNEAVNAGTEYVQDRREGFKETLATRIQEALVAYVIGDREAATDLFDSPYSLKNALNTLMDLAVDLARLKENERYDVSRELAAALKAALAVRELKRKGDARTPEQLIETHFESNALEGIGENVRAGLDLGAAKMLANLMLDRKTGLFGRTLIGYVSEVERENGLEGNDIGLFGAETDWGTKSELMKRALDKANGEKQTRYSLAGYEAEQSGLARKYSIDAGTASLVGLHEISEEKLRKAIALGGLANPSLGVVDLNARAGTGFGAITLIAPRTLIDKKTGRNAGTYAGDAWTPMVPQVKLIGNEKTMKAADAYIDGRVGNPEIAQHVKTDTRAILSGRGNNQYLRYVFLKERGIPVPERVTPIRFPEGTARKVIDILGNESFFAFESELSDAQKRALTDLYFEVSEKPDASEKMKNALKKMLTDDKGLLNYNVIREFLARARSDYREGGKLDAIGTISDAVREVSAMRLESEYVQWRDDLLKSFGAREQIYAGETRTGRSRYIDATLENISKEMNKKAVKDSGDDTNFGSIKASLLKSMTSLKQIRSKKELLNLSDADAEAAVEETKDRLVGVFNAINAKKKLVENPFMNFDYSVRRVKEALNEADPKSYLENEYGYEIEEKLAQELSAVKELMQNLPAKYFETKFRRPVELGEFRAAVVPAGTDAAVVSALKNAGVSVEEYAADDEEDRAAKVRGVAAKASDVRFSLAMEESAEYLEPSDFGEDGRVKPEILAEIEAEKAKIREDAQKNGSFGKAPNGAPSNLNAEQWVLVRTKRFKRWFGDWEFARQVEQIFKMSPIHSLTGTEFQKDGVPLTEKVTAFWKEKHNGVAVNPTLGTVRLDREGVKDSLGHGIGSLKSAAYAAVPSVIEHGIIFDRQTNWKNRGYDTAVLAAPITIGDKEYICEVIVETRPNRQGFYLHEVELKEKAENAFKTPTKGSAFPTSRLILAKKAYKVNEEGVSKVVDENGEPRVVYHQTGDDFTAFDTNARKNSAGDSEMPVGVFLKPDDRDIGLRGKKQMGLFAKASNIKRFKNRAEVREFVRNNEAYDSAQKTIHSNDVQFGKEFEEVEKKIDALYSSLWHMRGSIKISENKEYQALQEKSSAILKKWTNANDALGEKARNILTGELKRLGFDGVYVDEDSGSFGRKTATYVVFNPAGVKSATENVGTYARENPDIRYSLGQQYFNFEGTEGLPLFDAMREQAESAEDVAKLDEAERALKRRVDMEPWRAKSDALKNSTTFIANTFGFKKVNVGKRKGESWTTPKEVYDALLDLAEIVDVPPSSVGFGDLDLDVSGRATTRRKGTYIHGGDHKIHVYDHGSLAHEWMHALHDWFGGLSQAWRDNRYETRRSLPMGDPVRAEVADAFKAIEDAVEKSDFARRSREAERGAAYLSKNIELVARAFETYVLSRVKNGAEAISRVRELNDAISEKRNEFLKSEEAERQRVRSELLALKTELDKVGRNLLVKFDDRMMRAYYPTIEELDAEGVSAAFDRLFSTLKWKEADENGRKVSRLYSISTEEQDAWNGILDAYEAGELKQLAFHKVLNRTPEVLIRCGLKNRPITIRKETIDKITGKIPNKAGDFHQVPVSSFRRLLYELDKPIAVFRSVSPHAKKSVVVLTELLDLANGKNVIVPLEIDETTGSIKSHRITSAYGRPDKDIRKWISGKLMLYADKEKLPNLLAADAGAIPAALPEGANIFGSEILNNEDSRNDARGADSGKRKFSLPEMEESEETIRARARERARERAKQERARKRRDAYGSLKDIGAESRRMIQDFIREHNELYSDPAAIRKLKVKGIALAKLLLERGLDKADAALLDAVCGGEQEMLRRDVKARGELLARLMRENLDNTAAVKATVAQITAMSNRIGRMRAYARLSSMLSFGSAEAYDALDAIERERRARDETAVPADVDKDKLAKIGVGKRLSDIGLSADLSDDAAEKRENADRRVSEIEDEAGEEEAGDTKGAREDEEETESAPPPPPGARKGELRELKDTPKAVAESVAQLVLDTIFGAGKVSVKTMKTDLRKIGATEEQRATLMKTLRKTATEAITDAMHDNVPRESRARISVVLGKLSTETDVRALVNLLERGFALIATSSVRASRAQMYAKINRLLKPWRTMKTRESELNRRVSGEREEFLHACWKAWTQYHSMRDTANRMAEIRDALEAIAEKEARGEATEDDAARARKLETELHALDLVGGARTKSVVDLAQIAWDLETGVEDDRKEHKERVKEARERNRAAYMEVADAAKAAKRDPEKKMGAVAKLLTSVESLRQWFEGIIRYAGGETERKARERVDKIERDFAAAAYRRESLAYRRLTKLRGELERIFGKDLAGAMKDWRKAREELARFSSDGKTAMSLAALANLYAQVRQEHYAAPLKERERYSDENEAVKLIERRVAQIPEMEAALGEKGVAVVNALCGMLRDLRPELRAAFKGVTGYEFYTEENYFPIQRKKGEYGLGKAGVSLATLPLRFSARIVSTQDVVEDVSIFDAFDEAANSSEHFIAYSQLHMFWQQAFLDADFSGTIRDHCGRDVLASLRSRVTDILAPKLPQKETGADPFMNKLVSGAAITALGGNVLVMLRQFTSVPAFMFNMSVGDFAKYSATLGTADGIAALGEIVRDNAWFRQRFTRGFGAELNAILQGKGKAPAKIARALAIYMLTNNMGDSVPILFIGAGIFRAAYENGIKNGLSEADAKQAAHAEVARHCEASQQTGRVMNMGDAQRANGAIARAIMQFKSTTQQFLSYEVRAVSDVMARPTDAARWAKLAKVLMLNHFILPGLYSGTTMLFDLLMGGDPDEWTEDWVAKFALPMLLGPGSGIVFVGDALTSVSGGLSRGLPALEAVRKGRRLLAAGEAWIVDDDTDKALDQLYKLSKELCPPVRHAAEWIENHAE